MSANSLVRPPDTVTVEEAAQRLNISRTLAYQLARGGELPGVIRLGRRLVVSRAVLDRVRAARGEAGVLLRTERSSARGRGRAADTRAPGARRPVGRPP